MTLSDCPCGWRPPRFLNDMSIETQRPVRFATNENREVIELHTNIRCIDWSFACPECGTRHTMHIEVGTASPAPHEWPTNGAVQ